MGGTAPPTSLLGPFSPMFSKKMLNLKRERPPHFFFWQNTTGAESNSAPSYNFWIVAGVTRSSRCYSYRIHLHTSCYTRVECPSVRNSRFASKYSTLVFL